MNKDEYLKKLSKMVKKLPKEDREDILSDYEEHFRIGIEKGRTEEEISKALGDPKTIVKQIKAEYMVNLAENKPSLGSIIKAALSISGLGFFNLIFVAVPALVLSLIILALFVAGVAIIVVGILTALSPLLQILIPNETFYRTFPFAADGTFSTVVTIVWGIILGVGGIVIVGIMAFIIKWFYNLAIRYLKFNLRFIKKQTNEL